MASGRELLAQRISDRAAACRSIGGVLYAALFEAIATDIRIGGASWSLLSPLADESSGSGLELRLMSTVHRLVLDGRAPALAPFYATVSPRPHTGPAWPCFVSVLVDRFDEVAAGLREPLQTNEVGRSAALLGGYMQVAAVTGLPLRVLDVGTSAGLNLAFDRYYYRAATGEFGPPRSPVRFVEGMHGPIPFVPDLRVTLRRGCDLRPLDVHSHADRLRLLSYCWPDHIERFERLRAAIAVTQEVSPAVDHAEAVAWVREQLDEPVPGVATIVSHSILRQYLSDDQDRQLAAEIDRAGARSTPDAPVAWLRLEPDRSSGISGPVVKLKTYPDGADRLLARSAPLGLPVHWL